MLSLPLITLTFPIAVVAVSYNGAHLLAVTLPLKGIFDTQILYYISIMNKSDRYTGRSKYVIGNICLPKIKEILSRGIEDGLDPSVSKYVIVNALRSESGVLHAIPYDKDP